MQATKQELAALKKLTARSDFLAVQSQGKKWVSHGLIIQYRENDLGIILTGLTVSKKVDKSAVKRNRIKRRLRAVAADVLSLYAKLGYDYVLVGKQKTALRPYSDLIGDLKWCLKKTDLFKHDQSD